MSYGTLFAGTVPLKSFTLMHQIRRFIEDLTLMVYGEVAAKIKQIHINIDIVEGGKVVQR